MGTFIEILKTILPAIITGIGTFLITKYNYYKNVPLDKIEIAYDRVYYPIYKIIQEQNKLENQDINLVITKSSYYFKNYDKYVDNTTLQTFELLCRHKNDAQLKSLYQNFKNNIYSQNSFLRRRLGYLEPNFIQIFTYASVNLKITLVIAFELIVMDILLMIYSATKNSFPKINHISLMTFYIFLGLIIIEILILIVINGFYKIKTLFNKKRKK